MLTKAEGVKSDRIKDRKDEPGPLVACAYSILDQHGDDGYITKHGG